VDGAVAEAKDDTPKQKDSGHVATDDADANTETQYQLFDGGNFFTDYAGVASLSIDDDPLPDPIEKIDEAGVTVDANGDTQFSVFNDNEFFIDYVGAASMKDDEPSEEDSLQKVLQAAGFVFGEAAFIASVERDYKRFGIADVHKRERQTWGSVLIVRDGKDFATKAVMDTGADNTYIPMELAKLLHQQGLVAIIDIPVKRELVGLEANANNPIVKAIIDFADIGNGPSPFIAYIAKTNGVFICGNKFLVANSCVLDPEQRKMTIRRRGHSIFQVGQQLLEIVSATYLYPPTVVSLYNKSSDAQAEADRRKTVYEESKDVLMPVKPADALYRNYERLPGRYQKAFKNSDDDLWKIQKWTPEQLNQFLRKFPQPEQALRASLTSEEPVRVPAKLTKMVQLKPYQSAMVALELEEPLQEDRAFFCTTSGLDEVECMDGCCSYDKNAPSQVQVMITNKAPYGLDLDWTTTNFEGDLYPIVEKLRLTELVENNEDERVFTATIDEDSIESDVSETTLPSGVKTSSTSDEHNQLLFPST